MISIADRRRGALEAIDRHVNTEPTADRVLLRSAEVLVERLGFAAVAVRRPGFEEVGAGAAPSAVATVVPIRFGTREVGQLVVDPASEDDLGFLEHVARMLSSRCER